jgi:UDP:flavonoid glycosyltransferase YjiC (YdhE family)
MRVLAACSLGGAGHLTPLLPFLAATRRRGGEALVVGPPALREMVERAGFRFRAGGEPAEEEVAPIRERLPLASPREASVLGNRELFGRLAATAMLPDMMRACAEWMPDLVLRDPCEYASAVVAQRFGIPTAQVAISLAEVEAGSIAAATPALETYRSGLVEKLRASPYVTCFPASFDPSPFPTTLRFHQPVESPVGPLPDWWRGADKPLVYMTFGTVLGHMSIAADVYRTALAAVADLEVRVLLTIGSRLDPSVLDPVPANVRVEGWVEQAQVLHEADVVVCHGGSGTVYGALAAGVPVVAIPIFADQFENAGRVSEAGAGLVVEAEQRRDVSGRPVLGPEDALRIAESITTALASESYRQRACDISTEMATTPTTDEVLHALYTGAIRGNA